MTTQTLAKSDLQLETRAGGRSLFRSLILGKLSAIRRGSLTLRDADRAWHFGRSGDSLAATITVRNQRFYRSAVLGGDVAVADAYINGWWDCDDLVALIRIIVRNGTAVRDVASGTARLGGLLQRALHAVHRNTRSGSRRNIAAHYDLGNDFFALFLDPTLSYSCAVFAHPDATLEEASLHKMDRICRKLDLKPDEHLLEIGTGWGGMALHAAANYGCRVTTTTISREQFELADARVRRAGLQDRVTVLLEDYRDLTGQYDKLVSVEMIEAVGHQYYDTYFEQCSRLVHDHGAFLLQAITISDWAYEEAKNGVDFIKSHVFPGSCIPSVTAINQAVARRTDMRLFHLEDIGPHYTRTLAAWRKAFNTSLNEVRRQGYSEPFIRMWDYYLAYCQGGFAERYISDVQMLFVKPGNRREAIVPELGTASVARNLPVAS